jgi:hypothetical protein
MLAVPSGGTGLDVAASSSIGRRRQRLFVVGCSSSGNKHTAQYTRTSAIYSNALRPNDYSDINGSMKLIWAAIWSCLWRSCDFRSPWSEITRRVGHRYRAVCRNLWGVCLVQRVLLLRPAGPQTVKKHPPPPHIHKFNGTVLVPCSQELTTCPCPEVWIQSTFYHPISLRHVNFNIILPFTFRGRHLLETLTGSYRVNKIQVHVLSLFLENAFQYYPHFYV